MFRSTPRSTQRAMDDPLRFSRLDTAQNLDTYYTDTGPSAHKLPSDEVARYEGNPPSVVGRKFVPGNGDDLWEITEVTYGQKGWSSLTLHVEGSEQNRRMVLDDFFALLKNGTVKGLDE